jgi:hypothetical protein
MGELEKLPKEIRLKTYDGMDAKTLQSTLLTCKALKDEILAYVNDLLVRDQLIFVTQKQYGWNANGTNAYKNKPQNVLNDWVQGYLGRKPS